MKKLLIENIDNPAVLYQEEAVENYTDYSDSAIHWDKYGKMVMDYLFYRDKINQILFIKANPNYPEIDFSGFFGVMNGEERLIMCKYIQAPYSLRLMVVSEEEDIVNWNILLQISQGLENNNNHFTGRALLIENMRKNVADLVRKQELSITNSQQFFRDVAEIVDWYIRAACPDFKQWLSNEEGSPYESNGFAQKSYYNEGIKNKLLLIYEGE